MLKKKGEDVASDNTALGQTGIKCDRVNRCLAESGVEGHLHGERWSGRTY